MSASANGGRTLTGLTFFTGDQMLFFERERALAARDPRHMALVYLLGICPQTRRHFGELYDPDGDLLLVKGVLRPSLQSDSAKVLRLSYSLFAGGVAEYDDPTLYSPAALFHGARPEVRSAMAWALVNLA